MDKESLSPLFFSHFIYQICQLGNDNNNYYYSNNHDNNFINILIIIIFGRTPL